MYNFCSVSDKNYVVKLLTLFSSLRRTQKERFKLHVLSLDKETELLIQAQNESSLISYSLESIENSDFLLKFCKEFMPPSSEAISNAAAQNKDPRYVQYCWALAPYFTWFCLERLKCEDIMYIDADLYFYKDVSQIYQEIGQKSIGIIRHRIDYIPSVGEYNVGIVYFKNDLVGNLCSRWWKDVLLYSNNPHSREYGTCGDQKYLELFIPLCGTENVCVIDDSIGHLAPWSVTFHEYVNEKVVWKGKSQDLFFFHFAHFVPNLELNSYRSSYKDEWVWGVPEKTSHFVKKLYDEYFEDTKNTMLKLGYKC